MRAIALCLLALCLSACTDDTKYEQGYADALANKDAFQNEMEHVRTAVVLCGSRFNFYPKFYLNCDALATPDLIKKSKDFGVSKSYWFLAVQLPICMIALFLLAALALIFNFIIKISKLRIIKYEKEACSTQNALTAVRQKLANLEKKLLQQQSDHAKQVENASKTAIAAFKASDEYISSKLPQTLLKSDDDAKLAALLKKAQAEHPDFEF
jgi:hypothetical protein